MSKSLLLLLTMIFGCQSHSKENFDWLLGHWIRTNEKPDKTTYENWDKLNDTTFVGESYTIKDKDTVWKETVQLSKINNEWFFAVKGIDDTVSVDFKLISITDTSFTCENQMNEFSNVIKYFKDGNHFKAEIEGSGMKIPFEFKRLP